MPEANGRLSTVRFVNITVQTSHGQQRAIRLDHSVLETDEWGRQGRSVCAAATAGSLLLSRGDDVGQRESALASKMNASESTGLRGDCVKPRGR
jgi:hypothetical protein